MINFCVYNNFSLCKCPCHKSPILKCIPKLVIQVGYLLNVLIENLAVLKRIFDTFYQMNPLKKVIL